MIESIQFENFKALRDAKLSLGRFTLIVGPNGSGKSTALQALKTSHAPPNYQYEHLVHVSGNERQTHNAVIRIMWSDSDKGFSSEASWQPNGQAFLKHAPPSGASVTQEIRNRLTNNLAKSRTYSLDANEIALAVHLDKNMELAENGQGLAGVLDRLRDLEPERFEALNDQLGRWIPEFDRVLFDTPQKGHRSIFLRTRHGRNRIAARELSQGTLLALAMLTLAYLPDPAPFIGFEEPDRGIHPRLLRDVRDALYRLAYPENYGEDREPVQVVATTHSPYFVDLFKDHPEEVIIAEKTGQEAKFIRLVDLPNVDEILRDAHLGDTWYAGVLGGVPSGS
ncbi:MAG: AAA family ATPase [Planctomycetes bacterium]|nr:AAA family ATPase [Planctomycetota bacterium]